MVLIQCRDAEQFSFYACPQTLLSTREISGARVHEFAMPAISQMPASAQVDGARSTHQQ